MTHDERVYVIHENPEWFAPLGEAFDAEGVPVTEWLLTDGFIDLSGEPPAGVFWSRLSASAHTRGNEHSKEYGRVVLDWLENAGRRVINGRPVLDIEVSKAGQHARLQAAGLDTPQTSAVFGRAALENAVRGFAAPFIVKHNQGGKGLSVRKFDSHGEFQYYVRSPEFEPAPDGVTLVQEYLVAAQPFVTRVEFVGGRFLYAVQVDTAAGAFELCPAGPGGGRVEASGSPFSLREGFEEHPLVAQYEQFLLANRIDIAGIEFIETVDGRFVTYDVNTNTNYNPGVEAVAPKSGARESVRFAASLLAAAPRAGLVSVGG